MAATASTKPSVYLDTSFISYLTSRLSRNVIVRGNQEMTRLWWDSRREEYDLHASELVIAEAAQGNRTEAVKRRQILEQVTILGTPPTVDSLSQLLIEGKALPPKATADATHLAIAVVYGIEYLVTWNCTHLANARMRDRIQSVCQANGFRAPIICTPFELLEG